MKYKARDILHMTRETIWQIPDGRITIHFDDGVLETTARRTIFSWYLWTGLRAYPNTPVLIKHHLQNRLIGKSTHLDILSAVLFDVMDVYDYQVNNEDLMLISYQDTNALYNDMSVNLDRYVTSVSIFDYLDVIDHPKIKAANDSVLPNENSITNCHAIVKSVLLDPKELQHNAIGKAAKTGLTPIQQTISCVSAIGYRTEVDSNIFPNPILRGFMHGIRSLHDLLIETRSASKALRYTGEPLQAAEYFNRKLQLVCQNLRNLHYTDCGSTQYMSRVLHKADLKNMAGKFYKTDQGLKALRETDVHLVGKKIHMRTVLFCNHPDQHGICVKCFGEIGYNIPSMTNIGHVSATALGEKGSQHIMSTKHHDGNSNALGIELSEYDQRYLRAEEGSVTMRVALGLDVKKTRLIFSNKEASNLPDITISDNIRNLNIFNITTLSEVTFVTKVGIAEDRGVIAVSIGSRKAALSYEMLEYLAVKGWGLTYDGNYEVDLADWDITNPMFELPKKHLGVVENIESISSKLIGGEKNKKGKLDLKPIHAYEDPVEALFSVYDLVTSALDVNICHLETILLSMAVRDYDNYDFDIPLPGEPVRFGRYQEIMDYRSLGPKMAFQGQVKSFYDPVSYLVTKRPPHILDDMLMG